ncbi:hypothetical protein ACA910_004955 [Epithemia clementina (nom. ined.)]
MQRRTSSFVCDDDRTAKFYVNSDEGFQYCAWLRRNIDKNSNKEKFCVDKTHEAYDVCPETCGKCRDSCEDHSTGTFDVNSSIAMSPINKHEQAMSPIKAYKRQE